ncbi:MAG: hypothetical protein C0478_17125 [Planctomyces sp.]|nr:hypothetical protein [Planctomyces sp.]
MLLMPPFIVARKNGWDLSVAGVRCFEVRLEDQYAENPPLDEFIFSPREFSRLGYLPAIVLLF